MVRQHQGRTVRRRRTTRHPETRSDKTVALFHRPQVLQEISVWQTSNLMVCWTIVLTSLTLADLVSAEVPERWLLDPTISSKSGILAELKPTSDGREWQEGKYDGEKVVIHDILNAHDTGHQSIARVEFLSPHIPLDKPAIPVDFLYPVEPERTGDHVLILEDSSRKGEEGKIREADPDSDKWTVSITGTHLIVEIKRRMLVKLHRTT